MSFSSYFTNSLAFRFDLAPGIGTQPILVFYFFYVDTILVGKADSQVEHALANEPVNDQTTAFEAMFNILIDATEQNLFDAFTASGAFRYSQISSELLHISLTLQINTS